MTGRRLDRSGCEGAGGDVLTALTTQLDALRSPGLEVERTFERSGQWFNELCLWLGCPGGVLGTIGWPMVLIPEIVDSRYRFGESALQIYQRVEWTGPVPREEFNASAGVDWVSTRDGVVEAGVATGARLDADERARNLVVVRVAGDVGSYGARGLPRLPDLDGMSLARRRSLVVSSAIVHQFAELAGTRYPIHDDEHYARAQGYPTILVQGLLLFLIQLHYAGAGPSGRAEMWFRRPVPAGSLIESCQSLTDPALWVIRLIGGGEVAAIARFSPLQSFGTADGAQLTRG